MSFRFMQFYAWFCFATVVIPPPLPERLHQGVPLGPLWRYILPQEWWPSGWQGSCLSAVLVVRVRRLFDCSNSDCSNSVCREFAGGESSHLCCTTPHRATPVLPPRVQPWNASWQALFWRPSSRGRSGSQAPGSALWWSANRCVAGYWKPGTLGAGLQPETPGKNDTRVSSHAGADQRVGSSSSQLSS